MSIRVRVMVVGVSIAALGIAACGSSGEHADAGGIDGPSIDGNTQCQSGWRFETIDTLGGGDAYISLALDASGAPAVAYSTGAGLSFATRAGGSWRHDPAASGNVGAYASLVFTAAVPHIAAYDADQHRLVHAYLDGTWKTEPIATPAPGEDVGQYASIAADASGNLHVAYWAFGTNLYEVRYATSSTGTWQSTPVKTSNVPGLRTSIAVTSAGAPVIAFLGQDIGFFGVEYAHDASAWTTEPVASTGTATEAISLQVDSGGTPHVAFFGASSDLIFATRGSASWSIDTVDTGVGIGAALSIAASGEVAISYYDPTNQDLEVARRPTSSWSHAPVATDGDVGHTSSIAVDASGHVHVAFQDSTAATLRYAVTCP